MFAEITWNAGLLAAWSIIGLIAGLIFVYLAKGGIPGLIGFSIIGILGAVTGGTIVSNLAISPAGFWGSFAAAFLYAHLLIAMVRFAGFKRRGT